MNYLRTSTYSEQKDITKMEKSFIEQIALKFFNVADNPSEWYAGQTKDLESSLVKKKAFGSYYTSINMDEKKYAAYLKSLLVRKYGFEGNAGGNSTDDSTIVYIYKKS